MGVQTVDIIENRHPYEINPKVVHGASKWITLNRYQWKEQQAVLPSQSYMEELKSKGYQIIATSLDEKAQTPEDLCLSPKMAVLFGNEITGITDCVKKNADRLIRIEIAGFTQSYNLSVSVALVLQSLIGRYKHEFPGWRMSTEQMDKLRLSWYSMIVKRSDWILKLHETDS
jgi:tRNA (guanosine-2'-O-)-methyltransferase